MKISKKALNTLYKKFDSTKAQRLKRFDCPEFIRPNIDKRLFSFTHYGVMIPNLPEPFKYFSLMSLIGSSGIKMIDNDYMLVDVPRRNVTQVSGTALPETSNFASYSIDRDCEMSHDGNLIKFGSDVTLSGNYPEFHLRMTHDNYHLDITLTCHDNVTWFIHNPIYKHLSLMADYKGFISNKGNTEIISGHGCFEYFNAFSPYGIFNKPISKTSRFPFDFFTYQIIHIDENTQLLLAHVMIKSKPVLKEAYIRRRGELVRCSSQRHTHFEVTKFEDSDRVTPEGRHTRLPETFTWTASDKNGKKMLTLHGTIDTPMTYGLLRGYVGGYQYHGELEGEPISGRAYIEYVDCRDS
ncbi:hypothetical protein CS022_00930 [Veronia nyctiphanis]|uniref:Uncharacterized protein n=1 Tax=Veronia nyctiphanis TaxID=1278244 RepID=A0A4Q0YU66_9GAMM|nr:DUF6670 family protein [Veronia nyctiphanis]RXJ74816.1 hypothetical protein CS022_00930 [Veronia nyctiphanis]